MEKLKLYIFQSPRTVYVNWEEPPPGKLPSSAWRKDLYYHPDVVIYVARARCLKRLNYDLVGYHIQLALQDAHMPLISLRRERSERKKAKKQLMPHTQMKLWPME